MIFGRIGKSLSIILLMLIPTIGLFADDSFPAPVTAEGDLIIVEGRVSDRGGNPLAGAAVEFWQTDARGIYDHPGDSSTAGRDPGFQFFGTSPVDSGGGYVFRTILPGRYEPRPRHIHVKVRLNGRAVLTTQVYFREDGDTGGVGGSNRNLRVDIRTRRNDRGETEQYAVFDIVVDAGQAGNLRPTDSQGEGPYYPLVDVSKFDNDLANVGTD